MRIPELNNLMSLARVGRRKSSDPAAEQSGEVSSPSDKVDLSGDGNSFKQKLAQALDEAENSQLKQVVNSQPQGDVEVNTDALADRMLEAGVFDDLL